MSEQVEPMIHWPNLLDSRTVTCGAGSRLVRTTTDLEAVSCGACRVVLEDVMFIDDLGLRPAPTSGGVELTDELIEELADEAERGYEFDHLTFLKDPRRRRVDTTNTILDEEES